MKLSIALLLVIAATAVFARDSDFESEDEVEDEEEDRKGGDSDRSHSLRTQVLGRSGKIRFSGTGANFNETIRIEFKEIRERGANGTSVDSDHKLSGFDDVDFTFTNEINTTYANTDIAVRKFSFSATDLLEFGDSSTLTIEIYIFKASGVIQMDGVDTAVQVGTVKWNAIIEDWPFCDASADGDNTSNDCDGDQGEFLDFIVKIGSEGEHRKEDGEREQEYAKEITDDRNEARNRRFRLGASDSTLSESATLLGPELILSSKVTVDSVLVDQPSGFPKVEGPVKEQKFIFRFPRGNSITYDPVLSLSGTPSSAFAVAANAALVLLASLFASLVLRN